MMAVVWSVAARQEIFSIIFLSFPSGGSRPLRQPQRKAEYQKHHTMETATIQ